MSDKIRHYLKSCLKSKFWPKNYIGLLVAVLFFCVSLTPSLLPRPYLMQGVISGLSLAIGYGIGLLLSFLIRWFVQKELPPKLKDKVKICSAIFLPILMLIFLMLDHSWQNQVRHLMQEPNDKSFKMLFILIISFVVAFVVLIVARLIRRFNRFVAKQFDKFLPRRIGALIGFAVVTLIIIWVANGFLYKNFVKITNNIYKNTNNQTAPGIQQPTSIYRSGSSESYVPWNTLGIQGRSFVARGPSQQQMKQFSGQTPKPQIRVYVGLQSAPTAAERAQLAIKELERTGAFNRKVLIVATTTGTGWLEPQSTDSLEYMYNGDSAIVTQQYSYLPSWISFIVDKQNAIDAGQELFDAVLGKWNTLPAESRPKLISYGLSLGSFGGQSAFNSLNDVKFTTDGALFMGTPSNTTLWAKLTANRDKNSPEWQPIYQNGQAVRWAAQASDLQKPNSSWPSPRMVYMQHASDPVVWWNYNLLLHRPGWLNSPRGSDVSSNMHWFPIVTFLQVTVDQFYGVNVPNGHGHNYPNSIVAAWSAVCAPIGWNSDQAQKLQAIINTYANE